MQIGGWKLDEPGENAPADNAVSVSDLAPVASGIQRSDYRWSINDGTKFAGGFGPTELLLADYWTLRARSSQLFEQNLYARGIIRRLVTNEINTGLMLEAMPVASILGQTEEFLADWSDDIEQLFTVWGDMPSIVDFHRRYTWGELQGAARQEALIAGDVLCVLQKDRTTGLPRIRLIKGSLIQTPWAGDAPSTKNKIVHGVELDSEGRHVAYWVTQEDGTSKRLAAWGPRSGRRLAWLVYGNNLRLDEVRGKPILSMVLQSLKEVDRYRDSVQRKAVLNAMVAMFVKKTEDKPGTLPMTTGAVRRGVDVTSDGGSGEPTSFNAAEFIPGLVVDELQVGEEIQSFGSGGTDEKFGDFEEAIIQAVAWCNEVPPEILRLSFSNNYSASQAALNEFKIYLMRMRTDFGRQFCRPIYTEWLLNQTLQNNISAPGFVESWRSRANFATFGAWTAADWSGQVKPTTDPLKTAKANELNIAMGLKTRARAAREIGGGKYSQTVKQLGRENEQLAEANEPLAPEMPDSAGSGSLEVVETGSESETG